MSRAYNRTITPTSGYQSKPRNKQVPLTGVYIGKVKDNRDVRFMGRLKVWIPQLSSEENDQNGWVLVSYASPFAGASNLKDNTNANTFDGTQKSYGFWAVPPDLNVQVLVCFAEGDSAKGFWFACLFDEQMNFMVPGIASDDNELPKAEYNRRIAGEGRRENPNRPEHTTVNNFLVEQGLNNDTLRGLNSSSARRRGDSGNSKEPSNLESHYYNPSKVYGFLSPGGHQIVFDDGYINSDNNLENSLIRFRTRLGSQILIDDTQGVIYFITKNGKVWVELSERNEGNLDVYSLGNISLHSEKGNINLKSGNDINIQASRNVNIRSDSDMFIYSQNDLHQRSDNETFIDSSSDLNLKTSSEMKQESSGDFNVRSGQNYYETANQVHMNGPAADSADSASVPRSFQPPGPSSRNGEWISGSAYSEDSNIIPTVPQHEPWAIHNYTRPVRTKAEITPPSNVRDTVSTRRTRATEDNGRTENAESTATPNAENAPNEVTGAGNTPVTGQISGRETSLSEEETQAYKDAIGRRESAGNYQAENTLGYVGKYQFGTAALEDSGYIKQGTFAEARAAGLDPQDALNDPSNWTGKGGISSKDDFLGNPLEQEKAMDIYTSGNLRTLENLGVVNSQSSQADIAGYLGAAHLGGAGGAQALSQGQVRRDAYGSGTSEYFDIGAASINQLNVSGNFVASN